MNNNVDAFLALARAGLWEKDVQLLPFDNIDFSQIYRLAEEQSVVGLVTAGLEHVVDVKLPKEVALNFVGVSLQLEQRNVSMNAFIPRLIQKMRDEEIFTLLVKGQGVAQCYERPLWRSAGDIDLLLNTDNYLKAKSYLLPLADEIGEETIETLHQPFSIGGFEVELHGKMPFGLSKRTDRVIDDILKASLTQRGVRAWRINDTEVFLPSPDNDVILVFIHYLRHFFVEGVGLRQICDWCRLLWSYRNSIDFSLLSKRVSEMGLISEWKAFGSLAVNYLGFPMDAMPLFDKSPKYRRNAKTILNRIIKNGNFGHNNDNTYRVKYAGIVSNSVTFIRRLKDFLNLTSVFPLDAPRFFMTYIRGKMS